MLNALLILLNEYNESQKLAIQKSGFRTENHRISILGWPEGF
jgi:hypothetical protein